MVVQHRALRAALAAVVSVIPLFAGAAQATTDDDFGRRLWNLRQVQAERAWSETRGGGTVVAVVDSGVDLGHPDLEGRLVRGTTTVGCGARGTCGDGGWVGRDGRRDPEDTHGTHVAGTIAAAANNGSGVAGVAPRAKVMPVKALDGGVGSSVDIARGIRWATDHGADVINLSLGGMAGTELITVVGLDEPWVRAVRHALDHGVVVVAAAGNSTYPFCASPAVIEGVLCVTATDRERLPSWYSNLGRRYDLTGDTVAAPGGQGLLSCREDVLSTVPRGTGDRDCGGRHYDTMAGTSMASPVVAGIAALLKSQCRWRGNVTAAIRNTATVPVVGRSSPDAPWYGRGLVDAAAAVRYRGARC